MFFQTEFQAIDSCSLMIPAGKNGNSVLSNCQKHFNTITTLLERDLLRSPWYLGLRAAEDIPM